MYTPGCCGMDPDYALLLHQIELIQQEIKNLQERVTALESKA